ncbi:hypothetical protein ACF1GW_35650 [Streptomyces achromogenes]|uniref:hypothetical protein n=1 Tax=Streptomyces achromogenes TaxID=67255 RepID=UPI0036F91A52
MTNNRTVAYRSSDSPTTYCVICARQETGCQPLAAADVSDDTACSFCGGRVHAIAARTLGATVARYMTAPAT